MTEPHKRAQRHPKYTTAYRVTNWREYDQSLRNRGDIPLWISQDAIDAWPPPQTGKRGAQPVYADVAIETALTRSDGCCACRFATPKGCWAPS